jgi:DNA-binding beta-propeller fold protein YncE
MLRFVLIAWIAAVAAAGASNGWLIVANKGDRTIGIIDPSTGREVAAVPEGGITAHELVASPDGRLAYAPIYGNSGVGKPGTDGTKLVVVDLATHKVTGELDFGRGVRPHCPLFGPRDGLL